MLGNLTEARLGVQECSTLQLRTALGYVTCGMLSFQSLPNVLIGKVLGKVTSSTRAKRGLTEQIRKLNMLREATSAISDPTGQARLFGELVPSRLQLQELPPDTLRTLRG